MNIQEATVAAMADNCFMMRPDWKDDLVVQPTNTPDCCRIIVKGQIPCPRWNPSAEDLMAQDWKCVSP